MTPYDTSMLPTETREWLEQKARAGGYESTSRLVDDILRLLHELEAAEDAELEHTLLESLSEPSTEMTDADWANIRTEVRTRHNARKG